jgi:hypothetical protein
MSIFIENKYHRWYSNIISNAKSLNRKKKEGIYYERHHIIPRSMGGSNESSNLVLLTAKEHLICHLLLVKMTTGNHNYKMLAALNWLTNQRKITSTLYQLLKMSFARKLSAKQSGENNPFYGKSHSSETKNRVSLANSGKKQSKESNIKRSKSDGWANGHVMIHNGIIQKFHNPIHQIPKDFQIGMLPKYRKNRSLALMGHKHSNETKLKISQKRKGQKLSSKFIWINNGISNTKISENSSIPDNYELGRLPNSIKFMWITDGISNKRIPYGNEIPMDFYRGKTEQRRS